MCSSHVLEDKIGCLGEFSIKQTVGVLQFSYTKLLKDKSCMLLKLKLRCSKIMQL